MISSTILFPLQTIQARIIMQYVNNQHISANTNVNLGNQSVIYRILRFTNNMRSIIKFTIKNEGYRGFFKGYAPGISKIALGNAISFGLYENMKPLLNR